MTGRTLNWPKEKERKDVVYCSDVIHLIADQETSRPCLDMNLVCTCAVREFRTCDGCVSRKAAKCSSVREFLLSNTLLGLLALNYFNLGLRGLRKQRSQQPSSDSVLAPTSAKGDQKGSENTQIRLQLQRGNQYLVYMYLCHYIVTYITDRTKLVLRTACPAQRGFLKVHSRRRKFLVLKRESSFGMR